MLTKNQTTMKILETTSRGIIDNASIVTEEFFQATKNEKLISPGVAVDRLEGNLFQITVSCVNTRAVKENEKYLKLSNTYRFTNKADIVSAASLAAATLQSKMSRIH